MNPDTNQPLPPQWQGGQIPPSTPQPSPAPTAPVYDQWAQPGVMPGQPMESPEAYAGYQPSAPLPGPASNMPASSVPEWQPAPPPPVPPQQPVEQEPQSYGTYDYEVPHKRSWGTILLMVLFLVLLGGVGYTGYKTFFVNDDKPTATNPTPAPTPEPAPQPSPQPQPTPAATPNPPPAPLVADLGVLASVALTPPADLGGLRANNLGVATVKDYTDASGNCNLQFGTLPASSLPGGNLDELLAPQLQALRSVGATVTGPAPFTALELKGAANAGGSYTMSTVTISFVQGSKQGTSHYSASILKNGERAFVSRSCVSANGPIDQAALDALEAKARQITIVKQ